MGSTSASSEESDFSDSDMDGIALMGLALDIHQCEEEILFHERGYKKLNKICDTLQGELYQCETMKCGKHVAIKKNG